MNSFSFKKWVPIALLGKVLIIIILLASLGLLNTDTEYFLRVGDSDMYLTTTRNILEHGTYALYRDSQTGALEAYTGRMPGYELFLVPLTFVFGATLAPFMMILLQVILSAIATYALASISYFVLKRNFVFYFTFILYTINTYITIFDISLFTESLGLSFFILSLYIVLFKSTKRYFFLAGLLVILSVWLRQYYFPLLFILLLCILIREYDKKRTFRSKSFINKLCFFLLPILIMQVYWVARNYQLKDRFIFLVDDMHAGYKYPERFRALMDYVQTWGGDLVHWNPHAEITVFKIAENITPATYKSVDELPDYIYTSKYNVDSLKVIQQLYVAAENGDTWADSLVVEKLNAYTKSFKEEKKFDYYVTAPLRLLKNFVVHSGTYNITKTSFSELAPFFKLFKIFYTALYWFVLLGGLMGAVVMVWNYRADPYFLLIVVISLYMLLFCPIVLRRIEYRYFACSYVFLQIPLAYLCMKLCGSLKVYYKDWSVRITSSNISSI